MDSNEIDITYYDRHQNEVFSTTKFENFLALYDREPTDTDEISIRKNDRLILIEIIDHDILKVKNIRSKKIGLINKNLIKSFTNIFEAKESVNY